MTAGNEGSVTTGGSAVMGDSGNSGVLQDARRSPLDDREICDFKRDGFAIVGRVFTSEFASELAREAARLLVADVSPDRETYGEFNSGLTVMFHLWKYSGVHAQTLIDQRLALWACQLLDTSQARILSDELFWKAPGEGGQMDWHQDWVGYPGEPHDFVTCWIPLVPLRENQGPLEIALCSHRMGVYLPSSHEDSWPTAFKALRDTGSVGLPDPADLGIATKLLMLDAGVGSFHHGLAWHRSGTNTTADARPVLVRRFARCI